MILASRENPLQLLLLFLFVRRVFPWRVERGLSAVASQQMDEGVAVALSERGDVLGGVLCYCVAIECD
jgi:hypothetical protein